MQRTPDLDSFARVIRALDPWLGQLVVIGGWAHRLYRLHPRAQALDYAPLTTLDTDIAVPEMLATGEQDIRDRLLAAGFTEEFLGDDQPPATHYRLGEQAGGLYAEFLSPLTGAARDRRNRRKATARVGGVTTQRLRHIGLLLDDPWDVEVDLAADERKIVRVANPARFLVQKVLIHSRRDSGDRAKDILYMHDTLEVFGARLTELRGDWETRIAPQLHARDRSVVRRASDTLFGETTDDIRAAAILGGGRRLNPQSLREACEYGFEQVFR